MVKQVTGGRKGLKNRFGNEIQIHYFTETEFEKLRKTGNKVVNEITLDGLIVVG